MRERKEKERLNTRQQVRGARRFCTDNTIASENWHGNQLVVMAIV